MTESLEPRLVARWDLDKTYLRTEFDTVRDLVRTAVERPDRKRSVPGAAALLRELRKAGARVHILSGSPRQMRGRLVEKLAIDRVRYDELTLKPNLSNALRLRFRAMRDQLGYKLPNLLDARARAGPSPRPGPCRRGKARRKGERKRPLARVVGWVKLARVMTRSFALPGTRQFLPGVWLANR